MIVKDSRFALRVLRSLARTRRSLNANVLRRLINGYYTHSAKEKEALMAYIGEVNVIVIICSASASSVARLIMLE